MTLIDDNMRRFKGEFAHFIFNKCIIYTHDGASAKFSTNSHETDNSELCSSRGEGQKQQLPSQGFNQNPDRQASHQRRISYLLWRMKSENEREEKAATLQAEI